MPDVLEFEEEGKTFLKYKCLRYDFKGQGYPEKGVEIKSCSKSMRNLNGRGVTETDLHDNFPIQAATGKLREEVSAAVSGDQAFFYFRQTSSTAGSLKPIIWLNENDFWEIAVQDLYGKQRVMQHRQSKLTNVYIEKSDVFVTGIMPNTRSSNAKQVKAYFKSCPNGENISK